MTLGATPAPRHGPRVSAPVLALVLGALSGLALIVVSPTVALLGLLALAFFVASVARIEVGIFVILLATSSVIDEAWLPELNLAGVTLLAPDLVLLGLLAHAVWRAWRKGPAPLLNSASLLLASFLALGLASTALGFTTGSIPREAAVSETRYVFYYALFFPVVLLTENRRQIERLMWVLWILGGLVGFAMLLQYTVGYELPLLGGRVEILSTDRNRLEGVTRIIPPGESVVLTSFLTMLVASLVDPSYLRKIAFYPLCLLSALGVLLTFYRAFWLAIGLSMLLLIPALDWAGRRRALLLGSVALLVAMLLITPFLLDPESDVRTLVVASWERFLSVAGVSEVAQDESLRWRDPENEYALQQLPSRALVGLGFGARYRPYDPRIDSPGYYDGRHFIHNSHLGLILKAGGLAYLCFLGVLLLHLWHGLVSSRRVQDPRLRGIWLATAIAVAPLLGVALAHPVFLYWFWIPVLALLLAVGERLRQETTSAVPAD